MIKITDLSVTYGSKKNGIHALGPVNLDLHKNEICGIIGPSGCGKTTFLKTLSGIITNFTGEISINGTPLHPKTHKIGLIPQNFGLLPWKTVKENCLLPFVIRKEKINSEHLEQMKEMLKRLEIPDTENRFPNALSQGQKQRVAIVRSFLMKPDLLLMDEPFSALDAIIRDEAQELFLDLWNENKMTTFFVTHSIDEALYAGEKIIVISDTPGKIIKIMENPLFNHSDYKESSNYGFLFTSLKSLIQRGSERGSLQ